MHTKIASTTWLATSRRKVPSSRTENWLDAICRATTVRANTMPVRVIIVADTVVRISWASLTEPGECQCFQWRTGRDVDPRQQRSGSQAKHDSESRQNPDCALQVIPGHAAAGQRSCGHEPILARWVPLSAPFAPKPPSGDRGPNHRCDGVDRSDTIMGRHHRECSRRVARDGRVAADAVGPAEAADEAATRRKPAPVVGQATSASSRTALAPSRSGSGSVPETAAAV